MPQSSGDPVLTGPIEVKHGWLASQRNKRSGDLKSFIAHAMSMDREKLETSQALSSPKSGG